MLKPHPLLTILIFAIVLGLMAHFAAQQRVAGPNTGGGYVNNGGGGSNDWNSGSDSSSGSHGNDGQRDVAGQFDYYALVLSWSPTYCAEKGGNDDMQCNRSDGRRYAFVLHGLWPQYERGYPSECPLPRRPFVPQNVIDSMLDIMPSRGLVIHEYRTHGTCSGLEPERYFSTAHRLFDGITIPDRFRNPMQSQSVSPSDVRSEFVRANPKFGSDMIGVVCRGGRLVEVRLCVSKDGRPRSCGDNENQRKLCAADQVSVPPTRSVARADDTRDVAPPADVNQDSPLPGPRMDGHNP